MIKPTTSLRHQLLRYVSLCVQVSLSLFFSLFMDNESLYLELLGVKASLI